MGHIVAIGGGEIRQFETLPIDQYIVSLVKKPNPKVLFIPTASHESAGYVEVFSKVYGELGCVIDTLYLINNTLSSDEIKAKILSADIIYVGGGDTLFMLDIWKKNNVDQYLKEAFEKNIILTGLSAGSICWFEYGHSDSGSDENNIIYSIIEGLGFIKGVHCPHYNDINRITDFNLKMKNIRETGIAIENNCAIELYNNQYKIIKAKNNSKAYRLFSEDHEVLIKELDSIDYLPFETIFNNL